MSLRLLALVATAVTLPGDPVITDWGTIPRPRILPGAGPDTTTVFGPPEEFAPPPPPRPPLPDERPFEVGERLEFSIDYGVINAGSATMEVHQVRRITGVECYDIRTEARSNAFFSTFYKVWDRAQTFLDVETLLPLRFEKHQKEGGYEKDQLIKFDRDRHFALYESGEEVMMHPWAQDELSAFYYLRALELEPGQEVLIDNHTNRKNYPLKVIVHGREKVEVEAGEFECLVVEPVIREGGIFQAKGKLRIWVTDDERHLPVRMRTKIVVGSITASLKDYRLSDS